MEKFGELTAENKVMKEQLGQAVQVMVFMNKAFSDMWEVEDSELLGIMRALLDKAHDIISPELLELIRIERNKLREQTQ